MPSKKRKSKMLRPEQWEKLSDEELLNLRVRDLGLRIEGTELQDRIAQLYADLNAVGISFHPPCYLADEWMCPDRVPIIGIPFYLAHPRLKQLEHDMMLEVEGGTESSCIKLLRHESGHAINYAYHLFSRTRWRQLFGRFSAMYSDVYQPRPYSKRYVVHLEGNYAQAHPDEDFAETFAVCITPGSNWRIRYRGWGAMKKLLYVDHLIREIGPAKPVVNSREELAAASRMTSTLAAYYDRRRRYLREEFPGFYDLGLQRLFAPQDASRGGESAAAFLRRWRRQIIHSVTMWTGDRKFDVNALLGLLSRRCKAMNLYLAKGEAETMSELSAFVTAVMGRLHNFADDDPKK